MRVSLPRSCGERRDRVALTAKYGGQPKPGFIGISADEIGLGESIVIVGLVARMLAIVCCRLLRETRATSAGHPAPAVAESLAPDGLRSGRIM